MPTKCRYRTYTELETIYLLDTSDKAPCVITKDNVFFFDENRVQYNVRISRDSNLRIPKEYKYIGDLIECAYIFSEGKTKTDVDLEKGKLYVDGINILIIAN